MEPLYDTPLDVVEHVLEALPSDPESGDYVNAIQASHLVNADDDEEHEYSEIIKTVTVTKDVDGDGQPDIIITSTTTTVVETNVQHDDEATDNVYLNADDAISAHSDAIRENDDATSRGDDATSRGDDATSEAGSSYVNIPSGLKVDVDLKELSVHDEGSQLVEKLVEREFVGERIVESIVQHELEERIEEVKEAGERENIYEYIAEGVEELREAPPAEEPLYDETYATLEQTAATQYTTHALREVVEERAEEVVAASTFASVEPTVLDTTDSKESKPVAQKTPPAPATSGKFVLRSVSRADPRHVVQCITQTSVPEHNPEQDELVTYLKGESDGSELKQKIKSWITSPLIQQFNKEGESGSEAVQTFLPKNVQVSVVRGGSTSAVSVTREVRSPTSPQPATAAVQPAAHPITAASTPDTAAVHPVAAVESSVKISVAVNEEDPRSRNAEIAKAVEAAEFKPVAHSTHQNGTHVEKKEASVVEASNIAQGISVYAKQQSRTEQVNGGAAKQNGAADWKLEVEKRKQTKEFLVTQKPSQPIKLAEVPEWKKVLAEKNKQRKSTSGEHYSEPASGEVADVEWRKEIQQILKQKSVTETNSTQETPEWVKIADNKI